MGHDGPDHPCLDGLKVPSPQAQRERLLGIGETFGLAHPFGPRPRYGGEGVGEGVVCVGSNRKWTLTLLISQSVTARQRGIWVLHTH